MLYVDDFMIINRYCKGSGMYNMEAFECIRSRKSIRNYSKREVENEKINNIIEAAICAPSGRNGQPWRFKIIREHTEIVKLCDFCDFEKWITRSKVIILVFLDKACSYDYIKDMQSCGAAIQNMLLIAHDLGIGACWVGSVVNSANDIKELLKISDDIELAGMVTLGYEAIRTARTMRKGYETFLL